MTPIGHTLTGLAMGTLVLPVHWSARAKTVTLAVFAILANTPDLPFPGWGHDRYHVSHSVFVTSVGVIATLLIVRIVDRGSRRVPAAMFVAGAMAWYSHLLLDTFYNHGQGLAIFWPLSDGRVALPIACFSTMKLGHIIGWHNLKVFTIEAVVYGALLALTLGLKASR